MENGEGKIVLVIFIIIFMMSFLPMLANIISMANIQITAGHILLAVVVILALWIGITYNSFIKLQQRIKQASGSIDVYLKQRFDLIPNIVETVKGYVKHEKQVLIAIAELRVDYEKRNSTDIKESQELNDRYTKILALVENYPELKANETFLNLQKILSKIESQLQAARRIYNMEVTEYNMKRLKVPSNIVALLFGFKEIDLFEAAEYERENVETKF